MFSMVRARIRVRIRERNMVIRIETELYTLIIYDKVSYTIT